MKIARPDVVIMRAMLEAGDGFVSGTDLARELGMSRVAVWQHMEKLRDHGFAFEAVRSRGYRLTAKPSELNALLIEARLPASSACTIITLDTVDSTNDEAMRHVSQGAKTPLVVISREQTKGRGRLGRDWLSEPNGNLYITFALRPNVPPDRLATITPWIGVNLCDLFASYYRITPQIKWPNDLLINGRKAGGILTEARIDADRIRDLVIGCGLNLARPARGWTGELAGRAIALGEVTPTPIDINHFAAAVIGRVLSAAQTFQADEHGKKLAQLWERYDALHHREVTLLHGRTEITGHGAGIDSGGALLLKRGNGQHQRFHAGEVTIAKR
ncbi:biotin--[acetyl-CoA-carboxylase] ligase [Synoicihabitans lomoniglobus]|uniref:Bifunctional ligase/repressor BirA n=1 Tax=Synoicihabitans lomoniglobus TaxID=2909285 RepID=A0AAE9ZYJ9_9BACT|nr:biotin--[acetyl-CoA-carboxylase] ligase [Opitutaceae bacterium LMO-M01]WED63583.1 biotin--[acetyl-CoA-carboxylase] ligase [Opitutaceae bacterium LMO-M01]